MKVITSFRKRNPEQRIAGRQAILVFRRVLYKKVKENASQAPRKTLHHIRYRLLVSQKKRRCVLKRAKSFGVAPKLQIHSHKTLFQDIVVVQYTFAWLQKWVRPKMECDSRKECLVHSDSLEPNTTSSCSRIYHENASSANIPCMIVTALRKNQTGSTSSLIDNTFVKWILQRALLNCGKNCWSWTSLILVITSFSWAFNLLSGWRVAQTELKKVGVLLLYQYMNKAITAAMNTKMSSPSFTLSHMPGRHRTFPMLMEDLDYLLEI